MMSAMSEERVGKPQLVEMKEFQGEEMDHQMAYLVEARLR